MDVTYTFTFVANDHILAGSTVTLTLPTQYNLIASYPPIQISYPEFTNASSTQILSSLYTANVVTIYNVGFLFKLTPFKIIIQGMRNPNVASAMTGFSITITYSNNNYMINSLSNFVTIDTDRYERCGERASQLCIDRCRTCRSARRDRPIGGAVSWKFT